MAVHTGEARLRPGPRRGPAQLRAGRRSSGPLGCGPAAMAARCWCRASAADLAADLLPARTSLADLGSHRLRDLVRPEQVFQLVHPDLPSTFPPLRSLDELPNTLPTPLTSLLGRHAELAALPGELAAHRLVTLTGAGGVGKTRLAQQVAADLIDRYPGGTWWVELGPGGHPRGGAGRAGRRGAPHAAADAGAGGAAHRPSRAGWKPRSSCSTTASTSSTPSPRWPTGSSAAVRRCRCWQPVGNGWVCRANTCGGWRRSRPPRSGEVVPVEQLDAFDAVTLFLERARQARPDFVVDERSAPHIAAICTRLDGIALAIELAAARTRSLPVDRLAAGLDHGLPSAHGRASHPRAAPTDAPGVDRLELRPARRHRSGGAPPAGGLPGEVRRRRRRGHCRRR